MADKITLKSYPVKVDGIDRSITEVILKNVFQKFGDIFSVKVMSIEKDITSTVGYVNFSNLTDADIAAVKMNDYRLNGCLLKTSIDSNKVSARQDHRVYTDCKYLKCDQGCIPIDGKACPYRHIISKTNEVCTLWLQKRCSNISCPNMHPQGVHSKSVITRSDSSSTDVSDSHLDDFEEIYTCAICLERLNQPRELDCQHCFCKECLEEIVDFESHLAFIRCPECNQQHHLHMGQTVKEMRVPLKLKQTLEIMNRKDSRTSESYKGLKICLTSDCQSIASNYCVTCHEFLCDQCKTSHQETNNHDQFYYVKHSRTKEFMAPFCKDHDCFESKGCMDCECIPVCAFCVEYYHSDHEIITINQLTHKFEFPIKGHLVSVEEDIQSHQEMLKYAKDAQKSSRTETKLLKKYLECWKKEMLQKFLKMLNETEKNVISKFSEAQNVARDEFLTVKKRSQTAIDAYTDAQVKAEELFKKSNIEVIFQAETVCDLLAGLHNQHKLNEDRSIPVFTVDKKVAVDQVTELDSSLHTALQATIGEITLLHNTDMGEAVIYGTDDYGSNLNEANLVDSFNEEEITKLLSDMKILTQVNASNTETVKDKTEQNKKNKKNKKHKNNTEEVVEDTINQGSVIPTEEKPADEQYYDETTYFQPEQESAKSFLQGNDLTEQYPENVALWNSESGSLIEEESPFLQADDFTDHRVEVEDYRKEDYDDDDDASSVASTESNNSQKTPRSRARGRGRGRGRGPNRVRRRRTANDNATEDKTETPLPSFTNPNISSPGSNFIRGRGNRIRGTNRGNIFGGRGGPNRGNIVGGRGGPNMNFRGSAVTRGRGNINIRANRGNIVGGRGRTKQQQTYSTLPIDLAYSTMQPLMSTNYRRLSGAQSTPNLFATQPQPRNQIMCYRCGRNGHHVKDCQAKTTNDGRHLP